MGDIGNLKIGDIKKKREDQNKTGGINTNKAIFDTGENQSASSGPYAMQSSFQQPYMNRVESLANYGPLMQSRTQVKNINDIRPEKRISEEPVSAKSSSGKKVRSEEQQSVIKARSELKVFSGDVMERGRFTPQAKEAARHFFSQITNWAGSFDDGGSGFYETMGISSVIDCLYVDGMSLRNYLKEQYYYKTTGDHAQDQENIRNYLALIVARGEHVITLIRPDIKGNSAEVCYKNMYVDLSDVGNEEAEKTRGLKEKGGQIRSELKNRIDSEMTERTGMAYRKAFGFKSDGFDRIEKAKAGVKGAEGERSEEFKAFEKSFEHYNYGLQKLGLKPGRDDINMAVASELKNRCEEALRNAESFLRSGSKSGSEIKAAENAKKALETDLELLNKALDTILTDESARMRLDELFDSGEKDSGRREDGSGSEGSEGSAGNKEPNEEPPES